MKIGTLLLVLIGWAIFGHTFWIWVAVIVILGIIIYAVCKADPLLGGRCESCSESLKQISTNRLHDINRANRQMSYYPLICRSPQPNTELHDNTELNGNNVNAVVYQNTTNHHYHIHNNQYTYIVNSGSVQGELP